LAAGFNDICNLATVVIPSTNHSFANFCDYIIVSKVLEGVVLCHNLNIHVISAKLCYWHPLKGTCQEKILHHRKEIDL